MKSTIIIITACWLIISTNATQAQADPEWLKSWNEALSKQPANIPTSSQIAGPEEPGVRLVIKGHVLNPDESPAGNVIVHAYHRDARGFDFGENDTTLSTWRLQGWAKTNEQGYFEFKTIRPAADHLGREGAHIHITTISEEYGNQWARKIFLADDDLVTDSQRLRSEEAGKFGWILSVNEDNELPYIDYNILLKIKPDF